MMKKLVSRAICAVWKRGPGTRVAALLAVLLLASVSVYAGIAFFSVFTDVSGTGLSQSSDPTTLNASSSFFDSSIGTNGQACVTCHEPFTGVTITVPFINTTFTKSGGTDPLFQPNDTANNPSTTTNTAADYSVFLALGTPRIGEKVQQAAIPNDFTVVAYNDATNQNFAAPDVFPLSTDPQHPGVAGGTLSIFRRPLVNTNLNFDSSVLWDGRADLTNIGPNGTPGGKKSQVDGAITTLLLGAGVGGTSSTIMDQEDNIAAFMTGVYTAQKSDNAAGELDAAGATGGVANLLALSQSPTRPCVFDNAGNLTPFVAAVTGGTQPISAGGTSTCTPVVAGGANMTLFAAWANLSGGARNAARASIARGENIFNDKVNGKCTICHSVNNLGNNPDPTFMRREGHDSPALLTALKTAAATSGDANASDEAQMIQDMIDRASLLPLYCLRPTSDSSSTTPCGSDLGDVVTSDPARALVTGHISDVGQQKPPVLRNLAVRPPFFHNGDATDMAHLVNFYKFFLHLSLTPAQEQDLINFLNAL